MATKKASKATRVAVLSKKQREQQVETFSMAALDMAMSKDQVSYNSGFNKAATALLKLWGGSMEKSEFLLVLEVGWRSAEKGIAAGHIQESIERGVREGTLQRLFGDLIGIAPVAAEVTC